MCGILGYTKQAGVSREIVQDVLRHRGPDATSFYEDEYISFLHWRLSIIDLSDHATQPFYYNHYVLIYNGEVYNYKEVAKKLSEKGYSFETQSDTEVIIKAFDCWKEDAVQHFHGMFAFAVYDRESKDIFLFRDRIGVKPLYYSINNGLCFGSEMKAFKKLNHELSIDPIGMHMYFRWGYTPGERTIFKNIFKLRPGHFLKYSNGAAVIRQYWTIPLPQEDRSLSESEYVQQLEGILTKAFQYRMVADVPVGIFLSGGIDSSLLTALLQRNNSQQLNTFTIGFDQEKFNEAPYAKKVAQHLGTNHTEFILDLSKARDLFRNFYSIYDEPFSDTSGIPTALVSSLAREQGMKVVLSADGADEFFGGYDRYRLLNKLHNRIEQYPARARKMLSTLLSAFLPSSIRSSIHHYNFEHRIEAFEEMLQSRGAIEFYEAMVSNQANREIERLTGFSYEYQSLISLSNQDATSSMMYWDASFYLPDDLLVKVDRATMYHGVEAREPFLDQDIITFSQRLPRSLKINNDSHKYILRKILYKYLPSHLFERPKQGFSIPIFTWFSKELDEFFDEFLRPEKLKNTGVLNPAIVLEEKKKYDLYKKSGKEYNIEKMWRLLSFMMWHEQWMK